MYRDVEVVKYVNVDVVKEVDREVIVMVERARPDMLTVDTMTDTPEPLNEPLVWTSIGCY